MRKKAWVCWAWMGFSAQLQVFQKFGAIGYSILSNTSKCSICDLWTIGVSISGPSPVNCKPGTLPSSLHKQWVFDALIYWGQVFRHFGFNFTGRMPWHFGHEPRSFFHVPMRLWCVRVSVHVQRHHLSICLHYITNSRKVFLVWLSWAAK